MSSEIRFIQINPAAEADVKKMNEILQSCAGYTPGVKFTHSQVGENGEVKFFYEIPEGMSQQQESSAESLVKSVYREFMSSRIA